MLGWAIRLLLLLIVLRALMRLWRGIVEGMSPPLPSQPSAVPLAKDPVCGTFVVPARALSGGTGADTRFFCSENCRRTYESQHAARTGQASAGGRPPQAAASGQRDGARKRGPIERSDR